MFIVVVFVVAVFALRALFNCNCVRTTVKTGHVFHLHSLSHYLFILSFSIFAVQFLFILACLLLFCCFFFSLLFTWSHIHTYTRNRSLTLHTVCVFVCVCRRCRRRCQLVFCLLLLLPSAAFVFSGKLLGRHTHSRTHLHTHT